MNDTQNSRKLRVAIIGSGMGGLTCAATLKNANPASVEINLYEAASKISEIGAGISLSPRTWAALRQLGLEESLIAASQRKPTDDLELIFEFRKGMSGETPSKVLDRLYYKGGIIMFHRHALQQALLENIPESCKVHLNHRLISYTETSDKVTLQFEHGEAAECDLLIGADGIKSAVRRGSSAHFGSADPTWIGTFSYRALVPAEKLREVYPNHPALDLPLNYIGKNANIIAYPISGKTMVNIAAFTSDPAKEGAILDQSVFREATKEEMMNKYIGWDPEVTTLLNCAEKPLRWAIQDLQLNTFTTRRVALLGDAAHAMAPFLAAGACQAMEDAWILGTLISSPQCTPETVPAVLRRYNEIRKPHGDKFVINSRKQGHLYGFNVPEFNNPDQLSDDQYEQLTAQIKSGLKWGEDPAPLLEDGQRALHLTDEDV